MLKLDFNQHMLSRAARNTKKVTAKITQWINIFSNSGFQNYGHKIWNPTSVYTATTGIDLPTVGTSDFYTNVLYKYIYRRSTLVESRIKYF